MKAGWLAVTGAAITVFADSVGATSSEAIGEMVQLRTVRSYWASASGAALDSNLMTGGGTDDTAILQRILNKAENGTPVHLVIDGPALVSGLDVYGNTTVECIAGGGLYLNSGANRAIIRNVHRSRDTVMDERITIRGCFLHGNKKGQDGGKDKRGNPRNQEADGSYFSGLQFFGVNYLTIENVTIWNVRAFASHVANASRIDVRNVIVDNGIEPGDHWFNMDGFHFNGPIRYLTIDGIKLRTYDDGLTLAANDATDDLRIKNEMGPYVGQGPVTDVTVNNVQFMDSLRGIRLLSSTQRVDRVVINNVTGTVQTQLALISNGGYASLGNFGSIAFSNVSVDGIGFLAPLSVLWGEYIYKMLKQPDKYPLLAAELGGTEGSMFVINGHVENLSLRDVVIRANDRRPVIWTGLNAVIQMLSTDLVIYDPICQSTPIKEEKGSRIERRNVRLTWYGADVDSEEKHKNALSDKAECVAIR